MAAILDSPDVRTPVRPSTNILDLPEVRARLLRFTVAHYERLVELGEVSERAELIRGVIVEKMSKSPLPFFLAKRLYDFLMR